MSDARLGIRSVKSEPEAGICTHSGLSCKVTLLLLPYPTLMHSHTRLHTHTLMTADVSLLTWVFRVY